MTKNRLEILRHTRWRAAGRMYCGSMSDPDLAALVDGGFMRYCGTKAWLPEGEGYFTITPEGHKAIEDAR